jgi:hypothetical protein
MECDHALRVLKWGFTDLKQHVTVPLEYSCSKCDGTWDYQNKPEDKPKYVHDHQEFVEGCFACKIHTLQLGTGDSGRPESMSAKKWDKELSDYRDAKRQGLQPAGTSASQIQAAHAASEKMGTAYNADYMPSTDKILNPTTPKE